MHFQIDEKGVIRLGDDEKYITRSGEDFTIVDLPLTLRIQPLQFDNGYDDGMGGIDLNDRDAVYQVSGKFIGEDGTQAEGVVTLDGKTNGAFDQANKLKGKLIAGEVYTITETTAPAGYAAPKPVFVKLDEYGKVSLCSEDGNSAGDSGSYAKTENPPSTMNDADNGYNGLVKIYHGKTTAELIKYTSWDSTQGKEVADPADYPTLSGVTFRLTGKILGEQGSVESVEGKEYVTDKDGKIAFMGELIEGENYTLTETPQTGYRELEPITFTYQADGIILEPGAPANASVQDGVPSIGVVNESAQNTSLQFLVYDCTDGTGLAGAQFELTYKPAAGDEEVIELKTQEAEKKYSYVTAGESHEKEIGVGEVFVDGLQPGEYTLV